jgi:hypothetical protein
MQGLAPFATEEAMSDAEEKLTAEERELIDKYRAKIHTMPGGVHKAELRDCIDIIDRLSRPTPAVTKAQIFGMLHAFDYQSGSRRQIIPSDALVPLQEAIFAFLSGATVAVDQWRPITKEDRKADKILTPEGYMKWIEGDDFALWIWDDSILADADPDPPQPELCFDLPPVPIASGLLSTKGEG